MKMQLRCLLVATTVLLGKSANAQVAHVACEREATGIQKTTLETPRGPAGGATMPGRW